MNTSNKSPLPANAPGNLRQMMGQHPLFFFFLIAYAFSWIMMTPYVLQQWGILHGDFSFVFVIKSFGPLLAALVMTGITEGRAGVQRLWQSMRQWRVYGKWYLFILVGMPAVIYLVIFFLPGALESFQGFPRFFLIIYIVTFIVIFFSGGPLGEEPGWRGFALPRMQTSYGPLWGTLLLGVLWGFWHLSDFFTGAQRGGPGTDFKTLFTFNFPVFIIMVIALAVIFTWVFNHTNGSVFMAMLLHASINTFGIVQNFFTAPIMVNSDLFMCIGCGLLALLIIILTHGHLGYQPVQDKPLRSRKIRA